MKTGCQYGFLPLSADGAGRPQFLVFGGIEEGYPYDVMSRTGVLSVDNFELD
jgi:hypothetical protein